MLGPQSVQVIRCASCCAESAADKTCGVAGRVGYWFRIQPCLSPYRVGAGDLRSVREALVAPFARQSRPRCRCHFPVPRASSSLSLMLKTLRRRPHLTVGTVPPNLPAPCFCRRELSKNRWRKLQRDFLCPRQHCWLRIVTLVWAARFGHYYCELRFP